VYFDNEDDDVVVSDYKTNKSKLENDDKSYHFSISKKFVKDGMESVLTVLSDSLPEIISGLGGAKIGSATIKGTSKLPQVQRGVLGVLTGGAGAIALGFWGSLVINIIKNTEIGNDEDDIIVKVPKSSLKKILTDDTGKEDFLQKRLKK
jgi:hypothetical protein